MVLQARQQRLSTHAYPEVAAALTEFTEQGVVLDGELVVRRSGRLDFAALQDRLRSGPARVAELAAAPSAHVVFDLLATTHRPARAALPRRSSSRPSGGPTVGPTWSSTGPAGVGPKLLSPTGGRRPPPRTTTHGSRIGNRGRAELGQTARTNPPPACSDSRLSRTAERTRSSPCPTGRDNPATQSPATR